LNKAAKSRGISRRRLGSAAALAVAAASGLRGQATPDPAQGVREAQKRNLETLARFELPQSTEPAFQFRA
jgi:hypothetical protein